MYGADPTLNSQLASVIAQAKKGIYHFLSFYDSHATRYLPSDRFPYE